MSAGDRRQLATGKAPVARVASVTLVGVLACASSGCCPAQLRAVNGTILAANIALTACDWAQTRRGAEAGWPGNSHEANPVLGPTPEPAAVDAYFLSSIALTTAVWLFLPDRWRPATGVVAAAGVVNVIDNAGNKRPELGVCGVR